MTLDPVFRSRDAVRQIENGGFLVKMADSLKAHKEAISYIYSIMPDILDEKYILPQDGDENIEFLQNHFFLILFHSILKTLKCDDKHLRFYSRLNYCIKGIVTAADNLFDEETKDLLPIDVGENGIRFKSIIQLISFDRLIFRLCEHEINDGWLTKEKAMIINRSLLDRLIHIGKLEGLEEHGVDKILKLNDMIEKVHRIRGGALFSLGFIAPRIIETKIAKEMKAAENAIRKLGTAFQLVDDLTDFEFDLIRKSNNALFAAAYHSNDEFTRKTIIELLNGKKPEMNMVEGVFARSAKTVLDMARKEGNRAFEDLHKLGFWFPPKYSDELIYAIVGIEGVTRMNKLKSIQ